MKKLLSLVILLSMGITQIYAQCNFCIDTLHAVTIGTSTSATGLNSFAGGNESFATAHNSFVFGNGSIVDGLNGIAFGNNATVNNFADCIAIGSFVKSNAANALVFGTGSSNAFLTNSKNSSIMFGVNEFPSLTIVKPDGADLGYLGIGTKDPKEMAHVVGKVLIDRTEDIASSLQFKHPNKKGISPGDPPIISSPYYWDIYSDYYGLKFNTIGNNSGQKMIISQGGSVGIGIDAPKARLHVNENILAEGDITTYNKFVFVPDANENSTRWEISRTDNGLKYACQDNYNYKALQDILFLSNNGLIGVGKTNPMAMLDVNGAFKAESATLSGALTAQSAKINGNANITGTIAGNALSVNNALIKGDANITGAITAGGALSAGSANITGNTYISGNVGIGMNPSQLKLEVNGAIKTNGIYAGILYASIYEVKISGKTNIYGDVEIKGDYPPSKLDLTGNAYITGTLTANALNAQSATISGKIKTKEVEVTLSGPWPDFVFENDYNLRSLPELEQYIKENNRLPNIPSATEIEENGLDLGEMQGKLLQKIEEMTLYILQQEKKIADLQNQMNELKTK